MQIKALGEYITICPLKNQDEKTNSNLIVPKSNTKLVTKGIVTSIGTGKKILSMDLKIGDIVYYQDIERDFWFDEENPEGLYFVRNDMIYGKRDIVTDILDK